MLMPDKYLPSADARDSDLGGTESEEDEAQDGIETVYCERKTPALVRATNGMVAPSTCPAWPVARVAPAMATPEVSGATFACACARAQHRDWP